LSETKIGLGLAALGRPEYINIRTDNAIDKSEDAFKQNTLHVLDYAYKNGIRYFDTAPSYGKGEAFLQEWNHLKKHDDVVLSTKWGYTYVANWELGYEGKHEIKEHSLNKLNEQWHTSKNLLPQLKIYQVHSATFESGILKNLDVLNKLNDLKTEFNLQIGISTSGPNQKDIIAEALKIEINNQLLFDSFQVTYNVLEQSTFSILKTLKELSKTIIIKEALANGRVFKTNLFSDQLKNFSKKYHVGIDALALRFVIDSIQPNYLLSGASNTSQLEQNLKTLDFKLTEQDINSLSVLKNNPEDYWNERNEMVWN
jgi:aryl-alcohol dehydrogenase-like predicted oxidoreductase